MPTRLLVAYLVFSTLLVATTLLSGFMAGGRLLLAAGALAVRRG